MDAARRYECHQLRSVKGQVKANLDGHPVGADRLECLMEFTGHATDRLRNQSKGMRPQTSVGWRPGTRVGRSLVIHATGRTPLDSLYQLGPDQHRSTIRQAELNNFSTHHPPPIATTQDEA